ncbi:MAG: hypothetical protein ACI88A_004121 [Paraglaciecola sp.]|jgi:hypothetical protein
MPTHQTVSNLNHVKLVSFSLSKIKSKGLASVQNNNRYIPANTLQRAFPEIISFVSTAFSVELNVKTAKNYIVGELKNKELTIFLVKESDQDDLIETPSLQERLLELNKFVNKKIIDKGQSHTQDSLATVLSELYMRFLIEPHQYDALLNEIVENEDLMNSAALLGKLDDQLKLCDLLLLSTHDFEDLVTIRNDTPFTISGYEEISERQQLNACHGLRYGLKCYGLVSPDDPNNRRERIFQAFVSGLDGVMNTNPHPVKYRTDAELPLVFYTSTNYVGDFSVRTNLLRKDNAEIILLRCTSANECKGTHLSKQDELVLPT